MSYNKFQTAHNLVIRFREETQDKLPFPTTNDCLWFACSEAGEVMGRWLRFTNPEFTQNSDKARDEEGIYSELGDLLFMLHSTLIRAHEEYPGMIIDYKETALVDLPELIYQLCESTFICFERHFYKDLSEDVLYALFLAADNMDTPRWVRKTLIKMYTRHVDTKLPAWLEKGDPLLGLEEPYV